MSSAPIRLLRSEGFRLSAIYAIAFILSVTAMGAAVLVIADRALRDQIVQYSRADIAAVADGYRSEGLTEAREVITQIMAAPGGSDVFLLQQGTRRLAGNLPAMAPREGVILLPGRDPDHDMLGVGTFLAPGIYAFTGSDLAPVHAAWYKILATLLWLLAGGLVMAVGGGILVSRSFLGRTNLMATACRAIMAGDMRARIPLRGSGDELDRLAETINAMLDRIAALMENLRQVTNDIAHDLRTPVTHLRNGLERAQEEALTADGHRRALQAAVTKCDEILALFAALLRIAQIEGGARRAGFTTLAVAPLLAHLRELFGAVAEEAGHSLSVMAERDADIRGDRELLIQLFSNLIENAILHTPRGTAITVSLAVTDDDALVTIRDDGPGVPRAEHARLFQRLYRREASRSRPGYGLGLAIVAAIAELHGARLRILDMPGLCIELALPRAHNHTNSQP